MLTSIHGIYRQGKIELAETPANVQDDTPVIVTFLSEIAWIDLRSRGITAQQAATLRTQLASFAEDWDSPEMNIYDDYRAAKPNV